MRDIRQVVRRRASPPGGHTVGAAHDDRQHEPPALVVDLVTGKSKRGKSFQNSFHITAYVGSDSYVYFRGEGPASGGFYPVCTASGHRGQYSDCCRYEYSVRCNSGSSGGAAGDVGQGVSDTSAFEFPKLQPSFGLSSSASPPTLPWGTVEDSSPPFLPNRVQVGRSQDVPDEDSSFSMSSLFTGTLLSASMREHVLLPTTLDDFDDSVLGIPITYARCEQFPG